MLTVMGLAGALGIKTIVFMLLGIFLVVFILKKLFKLAVGIALVAAVIRFAWPVINH